VAMFLDHCQTTGAHRKRAPSPSRPKGAR
jgi:hypothetical protein